MEKLHLLIDSDFIKSYRNMRPVPGRVKKWENNPLFPAAGRMACAETDSGLVLYRNYPNVFWDREVSLYRCYYTALLEAESKSGGKPVTALAYAQSADGLNWELPELGITEYRGSSRNNLLLLYAHGGCVFYEDREDMPKGRYKLVTMYEKEERCICTSFSEDGLHFGGYTYAGLGKEIIGDTHNFCFYDERTGNYCMTTRAFSGNNRLVMACASRDFIRWSVPEQIFRGNFLEDQSYSMPVFFYAGLYLGLVSVYHGGDMDSPEYDKVDCELVCSPDCKSFSRIAPHKAFIPRGSVYDDGCVYCSAPVDRGDEFWFYYTGANGLHTGFCNAGLQLAVLKKAFLAGMEPVDRERPALLQTQPFEAGGRKLYVSIRPEEGGCVKARLLEEDGERPAEGFGYEDFDGIPMAEGEYKLTWRKKESPEPGRKYILEFSTVRTALYRLREEEKERSIVCLGLRKCKK